jgi:tetratricopeptide (TPR) repeat protein
MKRTERRHLKQNEFEAVTLQALDLLGEKRREITTVVLVVAAVALVAGVYWTYRQHVQDSSHALLAEAMIVQEARVGAAPPGTTAPSGPSFATEQERSQAAIAKFKAAADAYPSTDAGLFARYQEAALQVSLGNSAEAIKTYQMVIDRAGDGLYGQMSRLGIAEAYARAGQYEQAITAYKELAQRKDTQLPVDGILIQLGRTYRDAGKTSDAQQTFNRIVEEFPDSPFNAEAKKELDALKRAA